MFTTVTKSKWNIYHPVCRDEWEKRGFNGTPFESA